MTDQTRNIDFSEIEERESSSMPQDEQFIDQKKKFRIGSFVLMKEVKEDRVGPGGSAFDDCRRQLLGLYPISIECDGSHF